MFNFFINKNQDRQKEKQNAEAQKKQEKQTSSQNTIEQEGKSNFLLLTPQQKKRLLPLAACLLVGILLMTIGSLGIGSPPPAVNTAAESAADENAEDNTKNQNRSDSLCRDLEVILSKMAGVGKVSVYITYAEAERAEYAVDASTTTRTVEELNSDGSKRTTSEISESGQMVMGENKPVLVQQSKAQIQGVMVVAQGADDLQVQSALSRAVQKLLGVPAHRIQISPAG